MTSAAESITESLQRTRQLMVQEVERSASTLMTFVVSSTFIASMDQVSPEVEKVKRDFEVTYNEALKHISSIQEYNKKSRISNPGGNEEPEKKESLPRLNGLAQDAINMLQSLYFNLDLLAPQLPFADDIDKAQSLAQSWKKLIQRESSF